MVSQPLFPRQSASMADGTRSQIQLHEMEANWNAKVAAVSDSLNNKLDSKVNEVLEAIKGLNNALSTRGFLNREGQANLISGDRRNPPPSTLTEGNRSSSPSMIQSEGRQSTSFTDWNRSPRREQDLHRSFQNQAPTEIRFRHDHSPSILQPSPRIRSQFLEFVASNRKPLLISPSSTIEALAKVESPQLVPLLLTTPVSRESNSAPQSPRLPVRKDDPPIDVRQEQLHHFPVGEGEFKQSVHSFKDNSEGRATHKGELSTFNHQDSNTKVVCESDSEDGATGVSIGFGSSCLTVGVNNQHDPHCKISGILVAKNSAHEVFEKMPEPVSVLNMFGGDIFGSSSTNVVDKSSVISYVFDPGGRITKEVMTQEWNENGNDRGGHVMAIVGHQLQFSRSVASRNDKGTGTEVRGPSCRMSHWYSLYLFQVYAEG